RGSEPAVEFFAKQPNRSGQLGLLRVFHPVKELAAVDGDRIAVPPRVYGILELEDVAGDAVRVELYEPAADEQIRRAEPVPEVVQRRAEPLERLFGLLPGPEEGGQLSSGDPRWLSASD